MKSTKTRHYLQLPLLPTPMRLDRPQKQIAYQTIPNGADSQSHDIQAWAGVEIIELQRLLARLNRTASIHALRVVAREG